MDKKRLYGANERDKPNAALPYYKQWQIVPDGVYAVIRLFKPNKYPNATLVTNSFRVSIPKEDWAEMRQILLTAYDEGETIAVTTDRGEWYVSTTELLKINYGADQYGIHAVETDEVDLFVPAPGKAEPGHPSYNPDIPF